MVSPHYGDLCNFSPDAHFMLCIGTDLKSGAPYEQLSPGCQNGDLLLCAEKKTLIIFHRCLFLSCKGHNGLLLCQVIRQFQGTDQMIFPLLSFFHNRRSLRYSICRRDLLYEFCFSRKRIMENHKMLFPPRLYSICFRSTISCTTTP